MTPESKRRLLSDDQKAEPDHQEDNQIVSETLKERSDKYAAPGKKKAGLLGALGYVDKAKYDEVCEDDTDESDGDEYKPRKRKELTVVTERSTMKDEKMLSMKDEKMLSMKEQVKKLGPTATAFTIFKGYVATAVLTMPN